MAPSQKIGFFEDFMLAGISAGISGIPKIATAPIERVKLLLQSQDEMIKQGRLNKPYNGVIDCTKRVLSQEGLGSFWRGNMANVLRYFPAQALNFAFKEQFKTIFTVPKESSDFKKVAANIASGGCAGVLSLMCCYDLDFVRTRLANDVIGKEKVAANIASGGCAGVLSFMFFYSLDFARTRLANDVIGNDGKRQFNGLIDVYKKILASDGISGLYRGFVISAVGIFVYRGLYFGLFDSVKPLLGENSSFASKFALGYSTTISASTVSYPIDTIRRRMMMTSGTGVNYKSPIDCRVQIVKNEGIGSLFKGAGANILRGISGALVISGFDTVKEAYIKWRVPREN